MFTFRNLLLAAVLAVAGGLGWAAANLVVAADNGPALQRPKCCIQMMQCCPRSMCCPR